MIGVHRREALYPEPERFRPERFLERRFGPFEFFPFGGGARRCIGAALAFYELKLSLAAILGAHRLKLVRAQPPRVRFGAAVVEPAGPIELEHAA
jgi:cytochrome P450